MSEFNKSRTELEMIREIKVAKEYFEFDKFPLVIDYEEYARVGLYKKRDKTITRLEHNSINKMFILYGNRLMWPRKPKTKDYRVLLKGDMFILHDKKTGLLRTFNANDWTMIAERVQNTVNLQMESDRLTKEYKEKLFLY